MNIIRVIYNFVTNISSFFQKKFIHKHSDTKVEEQSVSSNNELQTDENTEVESTKVEPSEAEAIEISLAKRTMMTKLYMIEQEIEVFKKEFPNEYSCFLNKIESLRECYLASLEKISSQLTFEINPEFSHKMSQDIRELERAIKNFIETKVRFSILSKRLQKLITKLNILYNVSIAHPNEKTKVISQVLRATQVELELANEFKDCQYALNKAQLKERMVTLISYADYQVFKIILRNTENFPEETFTNLVLYTEFKDFGYITAFKAFIEDELSDLGELLVQINDEKYRSFYEQKISVLFKEIAYATDVNVKILDDEFWNRLFELESSLLEFLKSYGSIEKEKIKIKLIGRMNIHVEESEVLTSPKTNAYLSLVSVYAETHDDKIWLLIKLFERLSNEITYKEIYFLLLLFDAVSVIENTENSLKRHIEKYISKYSYDRKTIDTKKQQVFDMLSQVQYIKLFSANEDIDKLINVLQRLKMDFCTETDGVYVNSFYFNGLENIFSDSSTAMVIITPNTTI